MNREVDPGVTDPYILAAPNFTLKAGAAALTYELAETAAREALDEAGFPDGRFAGPLFLASPPVEMDWSDRFALYNSVNGSYDRQRLLSVASGLQTNEIFETTQFGAIADRLADRFGTQGLPVTLSTA